MQNCQLSCLARWSHWLGSTNEQNCFLGSSWALLQAGKWFKKIWVLVAMILTPFSISMWSPVLSPTDFLVIPMMPDPEGPANDSTMMGEVDVHLGLSFTTTQTISLGVEVGGLQGQCCAGLEGGNVLRVKIPLLNSNASCWISVIRGCASASYACSEIFTNVSSLWRAANCFFLMRGTEVRNV